MLTQSEDHTPITLGVRVHRFNDMLAISFAGGKTVYINPQQAEWLMQQLAQGIDDIDQRTFTNSNFNTREI